MPSLVALLAQNPDDRDDVWEKEFLIELPKASISLLGSEAQNGPDGWPYFFVSTDAPAGAGTGSGAGAGSGTGNGTEPLGQLLHWLSERGIGLAVNPQKPTPDYVLSYGMVWNFRERGEFLSASRNSTGATGAVRLELKEKREILTGAPSEAFLPTYARKILRQFLLDQGIFVPKVLLASFDPGHYDLCFSLESLHSPPESEHAGIAEALAWFLPAHYVINLVSEKMIAAEFQPL